MRKFLKIHKTGFTLIEMLVVIAVIGVVASIVLVSLSGTRNKAKDGRIQQDINQVRNIASLVYSENNSYALLCSGGTLCDTPASCSGNNYTSQLGKLEADMASQNGTNACYANVSAFCISSNLNTGGYYCVDAVGNIKKTTNPCTAAGDCPL